MKAIKYILLFIGVLKFCGISGQRIDTFQIDTLIEQDLQFLSITLSVNHLEDVTDDTLYIKFDNKNLIFERFEVFENPSFNIFLNDFRISQPINNFIHIIHLPKNFINIFQKTKFIKLVFKIIKNPVEGCFLIGAGAGGFNRRLVCRNLNFCFNQNLNNTCLIYPEAEINGDSAIFHIKANNFQDIHSYNKLLYSYDTSILKYVANQLIPYNNVPFIKNHYAVEKLNYNGFNCISFSWFDIIPTSLRKGSVPNGSDILILKFLILDKTKDLCLYYDKVMNFSGFLLKYDSIGSFPVSYEILDSCFDQSLIDTPTVFGKVLQDENNNCKVDNEIKTIPQTVLEFINGNKRYTTLSDSKGEFSKYLPIGTYKVNTIPTNNLWTACNNTGSIIVSGNKDSIRITELVQESKNCPELHVVIHNNRLRPCNQSTYTVDYNNQGTEDATNAYVDVGIDLLINLINASIPYQNIGNGYYRFNLGTIKVGQSGRFTITVYVPCDASLLGRTACCNAHIYPDENCNTTGNARLEISAQCKNNIANFVVTNNGTADMLSELSFSTIEDDVMPGIQGKVKLKINESQIIDLPANGKTIRILFDTIRNHPYNVQYSKAVEACGTRNDGKQSLGFINNFPLGDDEPFYDEECIEIRNSYDPNDKTASPEGYTQSNYIPYDSRIKYTINFQNTGNDTAYTVRIDDKISTLFDLKTLEVYSASHPMTWNIVNDRTLSFRFKPIALVDSFTNEPASKGYVTYSIVPIQPLEPGTIINNSADIFFDFNPPIKTNLYQHTLWNKIITLIPNPYSSDLNCKIYPNPFSDQIVFELDEKYSKIKLQITDIFGKQIVSTSSNSNQIILNDENSLVSGTYFFKILDSNNIILKTGKIIKL